MSDSSNGSESEDLTQSDLISIGHYDDSQPVLSFLVQHCKVVDNLGLVFELVELIERDPIPRFLSSHSFNLCRGSSAGLPFRGAGYPSWIKSSVSRLDREL